MDAHEELTVGASISQTGGWAAAGRHYERAYALWRDDVNRKGGILGRSVRLLLLDDESNPERAAGNYRRLIHEERVPLLLGPSHTGLVEPVIPVFEQKKLPLLQATNGSDLLYEKDLSYHFLCWPACDFDYPRRFLELVAEAAPAPRRPRAALVYFEGRIGQAVARGVRHHVRALDIELVADEALAGPPFDHAGVMARVGALGPDALLIGYSHGRPDAPLAPLLEAAHAQGLGSSMLWVSENPSARDLELGPLMNGVFMRTTWVPQDPTEQSREFAASYRAAHGEEAEFHVAGGYASGQVLQQAVEAVGGWGGDELRDALLSRSFPTVVGELDFGPSGRPQNVQKLAQWQDGVLEVVYPDARKARLPAGSRPR